MKKLIELDAALDALNRIEISRNASWYEFYQKALTAVGTLPSAQQWIPCSTEMPPTEKDVLVTLEGGTVTDGERWEPQEGKWFLFGGGVNGLDEDVIAWMPLPNPYRPKGEEHG